MRAGIGFGLAAALFGSAVFGADTARPDLTPDELTRVRSVTAAPTDFSKPQPFETMAGGAGTNRHRLDGDDAFSQFSGNLGPEGETDFRLGQTLFQKLWVAAPSSTQASDGLGPLYSARACQSCHPRDGRGHPPGPDSPNAISMVFHLSVPPRTDQDRAALAEKRIQAVPDPHYGLQLQEFAVPGLAAEGRIAIEYDEIEQQLAGGERATLRRPRYHIAEPGHGPLAPDVMISPRIAPATLGLGLLEAIHPNDILASADPEDRDGDGISGRAAMVRDPHGGQVMPGRFGWKATAPSVRAQTANAFTIDLGLSTPDIALPYGDCTPAQTACLALPNGEQERLGQGEAPEAVLKLVAFYAANLAVPARREPADPQVLRGKEAFFASGCAACHRPSYVTRRDAAQPEHAFQLIWPYSDLLLHDMGDGLADDRPVADASGREWRTAPLWGIGLTQQVSGHTFFLHDGRARGLLEAILWHGGEASAARDAVITMTPETRADLIRFLESL